MAVCFLKKEKGKWLVISAFFLLMICFLSTPVAANTIGVSNSQSSADSILPDQKPIQSSTYQPIYDQYEVANYSLDSEDYHYSPFYQALDSLLDFIWYGIAAAAKFTVYVLQWSYNLTTFDALVKPIGAFVLALREKLFVGNLFVLVLFCCGLGLIFSFRKDGGIFRKMLNMMVSLILAFTLLANMPMLISSLNKIGRAGGEMVFTVYGAVDPKAPKVQGLSTANASLLHVGDQFFRYNVYLPWQMAEFGDYYDGPAVAPSGTSPTTVQEDANYFLSRNPLDAMQRLERKKQATLYTQGSYSKEMSSGTVPETIDPNIRPKYTSMTEAGMGSRVFITLLTFVLGSCYGLFLLAIAGASLACHLFLLILAIFAPFLFLLVFIPAWGEVMLFRWFQLAVIAGIYKIIISLLLAGLLFFQGMLYYTGNATSWGWGFTMFTQMIILFTLYFFRKSLPTFLRMPGTFAMQTTTGAWQRTESYRNRIKPTRSESPTQMKMTRNRKSFVSTEPDTSRRTAVVTSAEPESRIRESLGEEQKDPSVENRVEIDDQVGLVESSEDPKKETVESDLAKRKEIQEEIDEVYEEVVTEQKKASKWFTWRRKK
ncbi:hypothetical protein [Risungbinella massiliensis]|uniref:hypothetical protein n=1 Tax=Risungbinella massiliensis TaxID=1329796 RepID=UPI0005CC1519|nr:hypothetical protein [Risungbinella massiliensis]